MRFRWGLALALAAAAGRAQPAGDLKFEVASLKAVTLEDGKPISMIGWEGGPGSTDPGRLVSHYTTLRMLLTRAYGVRSFQIVGPAWLDTERCEIVARVPAGSTNAQVRVMLQNLLAERFKLAAHRDKRDLPVYALTVGKDEVKLKPAAPLARDGGQDPASSGSGPKVGEDGFPILSAQVLAGGPIILFRRGLARLEGRNATTQQVADALTNQTDRLLIDETNLKGGYDIELTWAQEAQRVSGNPPPPDTGGPAVAADPSTPLFAAVREQLGLRVISKKAPVDVVVVDHMEKGPTEN